MPGSLTATVVVARTAKPDLWNETERWLQQLLTKAARTPGYVRGEIQRPGPQHPNEWVVVYEFQDRPSLEAWLASAERRALCASEANLFEGPPREQILATSTRPRSVTAVSSFDLKQGDTNRATAKIHDEFVSIYDEVVVEVRKFPGFVSCDLMEAQPGIQDEMVIVYSFEDRSQLDEWFRSDVRAAFMRRARPLLADDHITNVVGGFAGWFTAGKATPVWKQAVLILAALYPTALAIGYVRRAVAPELGLELSTLIGNAGGVVILSWLVMPPLTRRFHRWLTA